MAVQQATKTDQLIARRLQLRRKIMLINAEDMAFVLGMSLERYMRIEQAQEPIHSNVLHEITHLLNVPLRYFFLERM